MCTACTSSMCKHKIKTKTKASLHLLNCTQVSEKRVHSALMRTVFAVGDRVCQAADDTKGQVGSVIKVHEGTGRYSVNFGEDEHANGGGVQEVYAMDIRRLRPDDLKYVFSVAVRNNNEEEVLNLIQAKASPNATDQVCLSDLCQRLPCRITIRKFVN